MIEYVSMNISDMINTDKNCNVYVKHVMLDTTGLVGVAGPTVMFLQVALHTNSVMSEFK